MTVIPNASLELIETPGGNASVALASGNRGAKEISIIRQRQYPGGFNPPYRHDREEALVLLAGTLEIEMDGVAHALGADDTVVIPAGTFHQLRNAGSKEAVWLLVAPAGYRFYRESGEEATPAWSR